MITDSFDVGSEAKINPCVRENAVAVDACIITFSRVIESFVLDSYDLELVGVSASVSDIASIYQFRHKGKTFAFLKSGLGAPACVGLLENVRTMVETDKYIVFGGAGCLDKSIARGKVMIPTEAYRDEGTSYHYAPASDYISIQNSGVVQRFMQDSEIPYACGKTWTTDAFYRETVSNFEKHKADGCISVEMECSAIQAFCDFRGLDLYMFLSGGDLLDAPEHLWRNEGDSYRGTQHDSALFEIALALAEYVTQ